MMKKIEEYDEKISVFEQMKDNDQTQTFFNSTIEEIDFKQTLSPSDDVYDIQFLSQTSQMISLAEFRWSR